MGVEFLVMSCFAELTLHKPEKKLGNVSPVKY